MAQTTDSKLKNINIKYTGTLDQLLFGHLMYDACKCGNLSMCHFY